MLPNPTLFLLEVDEVDLLEVDLAAEGTNYLLIYLL
jgi:hypothetical protein